ncbi:hypothetical protein ACFXPX_20270 [Kitasatospora sp. NPDC059146]|uniref:hypothetical protein n=1 Tax=Kitasatospora sp. NPDC059146 TaxID=3346741 RepID=UPI00368EEB11
MPEPSPALERLVADENSLSDLLAFLFERDPQPLIDLLGLAPGPYRCRREVKQPAGRLDLVVYRRSDDRPVAVLEMKGASDEHGDQLNRYRAWAETLDPVPALFYCTFDAARPTEPWRSLRLVTLFQAWHSAADPHAAWLAHGITDVLHSWETEADGAIGSSSGWYVPDVVSRRTALALDDALRRDHPGSVEARAMSTSGGNPMVMAWRHHPSGSDHAWIAVDLRCPGRGMPSQPWLFRPCVDVLTGARPTVEAVLEAHDLAVELQPAMALSSIQEGLRRRGRPELAAALRADKHDGLNGPADPEVLAGWRDRLASGASTPRLHPVFFHDRQRRLATQFRLDVGSLTRTDLADLTLAVLDHLVERADALRSDRAVSAHATTGPHDSGAGDPEAGDPGAGDSGAGEDLP